MSQAWLGSCCSHTMKRYTTSLQRNKITDSKEMKINLCFFFSLLVNSRTLEEIKRYFESIVIVCLSNTKNKYFIESLQFLNNAVKERRVEKREEFDKLLDETNIIDGQPIHPDLSDDESDEVEISKIELEIEYEEKKNVKKTLKDESPFSNDFKEIIENVQMKLKALGKEEANEKNEFKNNKYVDYLMNKQMPYCFIWASFTCINLPIIRPNNGALENFIRFKKSSRALRQLPHIYVQENLRITIGTCKALAIELRKKSGEEARPKKKQKKEKDGLGNKLNTKDDSQYQDFGTAEEEWDKNNTNPFENETKPTYQDQASLIIIKDNKKGKKKALDKVDEIDDIDESIKNSTLSEKSISTLTFVRFVVKGIKLTYKRINDIIRGDWLCSSVI